jgi:hypothetical protein
MKKVIYVITSLSHKRSFESFKPSLSLKQLVVGPHPKITSGIVPEDYSDFSLPVKTYSNKKELQKIVDGFNPDIYVEASLPIANGLSLPKKCKKVYVSHGMVGSHVKGIIKKAGFNTSVWKGCDLYCGATSIFSDWVKHVAKVGEDKILLNAIPQFDIISDKNYYESYRDRVLSKMKINPDKVILFVGFCCKNRYDFNQHNEDYFKTSILLEKIARKNNWLVMIKPRQTYSKMIQFLKSHKWGKKYLSDYAKIQNSKHLHFITTNNHIYRYFFVNAIIINGTSTVEIEACVMQKPLFIIQDKCSGCIDPFGTKLLGAAVDVSDLQELEYCLTEHFDSGGFHMPEKQAELLRKMKISVDGYMYKRIQNKLENM